jgi:ribonuclease HII
MARRRQPRSEGLVLGIDEAGRGPILGPMTMACVALSAEAAASLLALGVTDSKRFGAGPKAHAARQALILPIYEHAAHVAVSVVEVEEIDARAGQLNHVEREHAARLISGAPEARFIFADGKHLFGPLKESFPHLVAVDRAEEAHVAVAAASLIAKVRRDELWLEICRRYQSEFCDELSEGHAGGGYCNAATRRFLRAYCGRYGRLPPEGRRSWPWDFVADLIALEGHIVSSADPRDSSALSELLEPLELPGLG